MPDPGSKPVRGTDGSSHPVSIQDRVRHRGGGLLGPEPELCADLEEAQDPPVDLLAELVLGVRVDPGLNLDPLEEPGTSSSSFNLWSLARFRAAASWAT
jgi:hypothetical protein